MYRFKCDGQELRCIVHDTAASGYIDTVNAAFELCKRWDGMDVTVQYTQTQNGAERTFNEHLDSATGEAKVSNSLIDGPVKVSIFGYIRETGARLTSEPCEIHINKSGYKENGEPPLPPEPDLYAHLLQEVDEIVKKGISDRQVADAVNAHLAEHPPKVETDTTLAIPGDAADAAAVGEALDTLEKEKLSASDLPTAIDDALAKAKASGEFDGADGADGKPGADGAPGKDGFTPTLTLERVEDGMQVKATNADGEQVETVYDGSKNVFVANSDTTAAEIRAAVKAKKVCIYIDNGVVYTYDGESEYGPTFRAVPLANVANGTLTERYVRFESDGHHRYSMGGRRFVNPQKLKLTGAVEAEYDGSTTTTVVIPAGGNAEGGGNVDAVSDEEVLGALAENDLMLAVGDTDGVLCDENGTVIEW